MLGFEAPDTRVLAGQGLTTSWRHLHHIGICALGIVAAESLLPQKDEPFGIIPDSAPAQKLRLAREKTPWSCWVCFCCTVTASHASPHVPYSVCEGSHAVASTVVAHSGSAPGHHSKLDSAIGKRKIQTFTTNTVNSIIL
ncbi:hypothetical protein H920_05655 [Fukomys damarensis]|uniref:Uncharacterized protein n=1 Tax=Fukomys damarensis TaxID=885580 RepID=A0A091DLM9_FUKDA|nr:hypothetical protein H920_05655 [Fukomys damarensis]